MFTVKLLNIALVSGFREPAFLIKQGEDAHRTLNQINGWLQVQTEINEGPLNTFSLVLFL